MPFGARSASLGDQSVVATARMLPAASRPLTFALLALTLVQPLLGLAFILAVGQFVGRIPAVVAGAAGEWVGALALVAACYLALQLVSAVAEVVEWRLGQRLNSYLDDRMMSLMLAPPGIAHLEDARTRDLAAEVADGLGAGWWRPAKTPGALRGLVGGALGLATAFGVVIWLQRWLGLVLAVVAVWSLYAVIAHSLRVILGQMQDSGDSEYRRVAYEREAALSPASAKEVRLFGFAPWVLDRWQARLMRVLALDLRKIARLDAPMVASVLAFTIVLGGAFTWTAVQAGRGEIGLAAATVLAQALLAPLAQIGPVGQAVITLRLAGRPVRALLDLEKAMVATHEPAGTMSAGTMSAGTMSAGTMSAGTFSAGTGSAGTAPAVRLESVSFSYPGSATEVLQGLNLEIPAGSSLAVVGLNGAGKTTLVKLLCRFYEPTSGRITVDGTDLRDLDHRGWQRRVAAIFADFARFPLSARDNIGVGSLGAPPERVLAAASRSGIDQVVAELPAGWDTTLSREFTDGADLSGGQWQRVALSRALLAADSGAGLLVLDEPAANLDVRAEAELNDLILRRFDHDPRSQGPTDGLTTVVISHRFSTVRQADRICVLDGGRVTESGSHDELVSAGGRYAHLFQLQAERFAE